MISLKGLSRQQLRDLAADATALADDLGANEPSYALALAAGISDDSYRTTRYGFVAKYSGTAEITMADGTKWKAVGHGPCGGASYVDKEGWIEFIPII